MGRRKRQKVSTVVFKEILTSYRKRADQAEIHAQDVMVKVQRRTKTKHTIFTGLLC